MKFFLILVLIYLAYVAWRVIRNVNRQVDDIRDQAERFRQQYEQRPGTESGPGAGGFAGGSPGEKDITARSRIVEEKSGAGGESDR